LPRALQALRKDVAEEFKVFVGATAHDYRASSDSLADASRRHVCDLCLCLIVHGNVLALKKQKEELGLSEFFSGLRASLPKVPTLVDANVADRGSAHFPRHELQGEHFRKGYSAVLLVGVGLFISHEVLVLDRMEKLAATASGLPLLRLNLGEQGEKLERLGVHVLDVGAELGFVTRLVSFDDIIETLQCPPNFFLFRLRPRTYPEEDFIEVVELSTMNRMAVL
jgi:hypothetical protein